MSEIIITDRRGNAEERAVTTTTSLAAPADWLVELMGGGTTVAGIEVTRQLALTLGAVWKAVNIIATDVAKTPLNLVEETEGRKEILRNDPAHWILRHQPNSMQNAFEYKYQRMVHKLLYGRSFGFKMLNGRGEVTEILPLLPDSVAIRYVRGRYLFDVTLFYDDGSSSVFELDQSQIIYEKWFSYDGVQASGVLATARELMARLIAMRNFGSSVFKNSARPATVIKLAAPMKNEAAQEKFVQSWQAMYSGTENAHKTAVLPPGAELQPFGNTARDSQFIELEQQCTREVGNFFLMPASMLNEVTKSGYNSQEQDALAYLSGCLDGHLVCMEESSNSALLTQKQRQNGRYFKFDRKGLRVADLKTMGEYFSKALGNNRAWLLPNEVRGDLGLNPVDGGDELPEPLAATGKTDPISMPEAEDSSDDTAEDISESVRAVLIDALQRAVTRAVNEAKRAYKRSGEVGAIGAVDVRKCEATRKSMAPAVAVFSRMVTPKESIIELLAVDLIQAVRSAASAGPEQFDARIAELTAEIPERLAA